MKKFEDYFEKEMDYPESIALEILPINVLWNFVSHTFLNGFINYVKIIDLVCVGNIEKKDLSEFKEKFHSKLSFFNENMSVLARINENTYMYFYYDLDVSDCEIARFTTDDTEEIIIDKFRNNFSELHTEFSVIPTQYVSGWVSF